MKNTIIDLLQMGVCTVKFKKVSGTERVMKATLMEDKIPADMRPSEVTPAAKMREDNYTGVVACWDVEADGWRSFRVDLLTSIEDPSGSKEWYLNGKLHREEGPAIEDPSGSEYWYLNDELHRQDGPAVECSDGYKSWYLNGIRHREDGAALEFPGGSKYWYLNGVEYTEEEFNKKMSAKVEMTMSKIKSLVALVGKKVKVVK